jgi:hypothetical protein
MLQAGRSPVRDPDEVDFFNVRNPSSPGVDSASNRNEYQKVSWGRRVGLTTLPPSLGRMSENVGALTSRNPKGLHGLYGKNFNFTIAHLIDESIV